MKHALKKATMDRPWRFNLDNFFNDDWSAAGAGYPAINVAENENKYLVDVVAPGFKKEDFKLRVEDDVLTITAESTHENSENGNEYTRREYSYNSFTRSFRLPDDVKDDAVEAAYQEGILKLEIPKSEQEVRATREIAVK